MSQQFLIRHFESLPAHEGNKKSSTKPSITKSGKATKTKEPAKVSVKKHKSQLKTKPFKEKVIRDSFSFPEHDYLKISELKQTCLAEGIHVKKANFFVQDSTYLQI